MFVALYALALQQCLATVGQPYAAAVAHAAARKAALQVATAALQAAGVAGAAAGAAPAAAAPPEPVVDEADPWEEAAAAAPTPAGGAAWAAETVSFGSTLPEDEDETPLPHVMLPAFWAMVLMVRARGTPMCAKLA